MPLFVRWVVVFACLSVLGGAVFGLARGLHYPPTLPIAIVEGAFLVGVPVTLLGLLLGALHELIAGIRAHMRRRRQAV